MRSAFKFIFSGLVIGLAFSATYASSVVAISRFDTISIILLGAVVNTILILGVLSFIRSKIIANAILSLIVLLGVLTTYVIHTYLYYSQYNYLLISLVIGMFYFMLFVGFRVIDDLRWGGALLSVLALSGIVITSSISLSRLSHIPLGNLGCLSRYIQTGVTECGPEVTTTEASNIYFEKIPSVYFEKTPNIYFIGFESIIPESITNKHLNLEDTRFHKIFRENFRRLPNMFSNSPWTVPSFNTLLSLDEGSYLELIEDFDPLYLFSGQHPSPLLLLLRENGYQTKSIYYSKYLGFRKGPNIDNYIPIDTSPSIVCDLLDESIRPFSFWGYCQLITLTNKSLYAEDSNQLMVEHILSASSYQEPQFIIAHLTYPGHTSKEFQRSDSVQFEMFRNHYLRASEQASIYLEQIVNHIENSDPDAILFVFGDHGVHLDQGMTIEDDPVFFMHDNFGILGGVWPKDICSPYFDTAAPEGYMTTLSTVHTILNCLSEKENFPVGSAPDSPIVGIPPNSSYHYREFLYE